MTVKTKLQKELTFLQQFKEKHIVINTTAKHALDFNVQPRRYFNDIAMASFMINKEDLLKETLDFFDQHVDYILIDIEQKQTINLYEHAVKYVKHAKLMTTKPNDKTVESVDLLVRHYYEDNIISKNILIIGTGNLAGKIALRLAERQANVVIKGRTREKERAVTDGLNLILPAHTNDMTSYTDAEWPQYDLIISALSGQFTNEDILIPLLNSNSFIIDVGINNFSRSFIEWTLEKEIKMIRLDTRLAFPYQLLANHPYSEAFFSDICGKRRIHDIELVSGGFVGKQGAVIVDHLINPQQIIGIADGCGGVKAYDELSEGEKTSIKKIQTLITAHD